MERTARPTAWLALGALLAAACSSKTPEKLCKHYEKISGVEFDQAAMKQCADGAKGFLEEHGRSAFGALADCVMKAETIDEAAACEEMAMATAAASEPRDMGAMDRYKAKSQTSEARALVKMMYSSARAYWMDSNYSADSMQPLAPQFPDSVGPTPPLGACCEQGGKCAPDSSLWMDPSWAALQFSVDDPHYYSYAFESTRGEPGATDGSHSFRAIAYGDLDCDGEYSTFEMVGVIDETYADAPAGTASISVMNELE